MEENLLKEAGLWPEEHGKMQVEQAKRLKTLKQENVRLKRLVAERS